jgi:hypothetical protein
MEVCWFVLEMEWAQVSFEIGSTVPPTFKRICKNYVFCNEQKSLFFFNNNFTANCILNDIITYLVR